MPSLIDSDTKVSVSSVMNKDIKQFGKKHLIDGCFDTAWNSEEGDTQWVLLNFNKTIYANTIKVQFQGGFGCKEMEVDFIKDDQNIIKKEFYLKDTNKEQKIDLEHKIDCSQIKFLLKNLTDEFGRVIIYKIDVLLN